MNLHAIAVTKMTKRLKQSNLLDLFAKKSRNECADDIQDSFSNWVKDSLHEDIEKDDHHEEVESIAQSDDVNTISDDDHSYMNDSAADGQEQPTKSLDSHLCQSACCSDVTKPYKPTNNHLLSVMANGDRNFIARWYTNIQLVNIMY